MGELIQAYKKKARNTAVIFGIGVVVGAGVTLKALKDENPETSKTVATGARPSSEGSAAAAAGPMVLKQYAGLYTGQANDRCGVTNASERVAVEDTGGQQLKVTVLDGEWDLRDAPSNDCPSVVWTDRGNVRTS